MVGGRQPRDFAADFARHRRLVRVGQVLLAVAAVVALVHFVAHLLSEPSGLVDLVAGYPMAGVLFLLGAVLAGRACRRSGDGMVGHSALPVTAVLVAGAVSVGSHVYRLPAHWWPAIAAIGLGSLAVPALAMHYASNHWDLAALVALTVATFEAAGHSSRTRTAQLPVGWSRRLDSELLR